MEDQSNEHAPLVPGQQNNLRKKILKGSFYVLPFSMAVLALALSSVSLHLSQSHEIPSHEINIPVVKYATYERIGNTECHGAEKIYNGVTVSYNTSAHYTGFRCLSTNASDIIYQDISEYNNTEEIFYGKAAEYKTFTKSNNHNAACAVCMVKERGSIMVLPGTNKCLDSWTMEYSGYLMTGNTCVDIKMIVIATTDTYNGGPTLRHEVATTEISNEYEKDKVLSCVVCSK